MAKTILITGAGSGFGLGANEEVLKGPGYSDAELIELRAKKVILA